jgi:hypothetical protein
VLIIGLNDQNQSRKTITKKIDRKSNSECPIILEKAIKPSESRYMNEGESNKGEGNGRLK